MKFQKIRLFIFLLTALAISAILILYARSSYPVPYTDSIVYIPTAINLAAKKGMLNEVCNLSHMLDKTGQARFIYSVPLFPLLLSLWMPSPDPKSAFLILAVWFSLILLLTAFLFEKIVLLKKTEPSAWPFAFGIVSLFSMSNIFTGHGGSRPDNLAMLWFCLCLWLATQVPHAKRHWIFSSGLGLIAATFPVGAIFSSILIFAYYVSHEDARSAVLHSLSTYGISLVPLFGVLALSPLPIQEVLPGIFRHSHYALQTYWKNTLGSYFFYANAFMYGVILILTLATVVFLHSKYRRQIRSPKLLILVEILMLGCFYWFSVRVSNKAINLLMFAPLFYGLLIYYAVHETKNFLIRVLLLLCISLPSINFFRIGALYPFYLNKGVSLEESRQFFKKYQKAHQNFQIFGVSDALWVLSEDYSRMVMCQADMQRCDTNRKDMAIFWQQAGSHQMQPKSELLGYELKVRNYRNEVPRLFGLPLAHSMPGYGFAVYEPKENIK